MGRRERGEGEGEDLGQERRLEGRYVGCMGRQKQEVGKGIVMIEKQEVGQGRRMNDTGRKDDNQVPDITRYKAEPQKEPQEPPYLVEELLIWLMWYELFGRTLTG